MKEIIGTSNKVLEVDLTSGTFSEFTISDQDRKLYLGGKGLGLKLLYDRMPAGVDPLGEENQVAFMMGVLLGTGAPCAGRFAAVTKSPLTGIMVSSSCGGPFGMALKTSGWDGLIIKGKSDKPVYISIDSAGAIIKDAGDLWGKDTHQAQEVLNQEGSGAVVIGPAGENLVSYANLCSGHRFLGRGGMGAVLGSKNLKGIVAKGKEFKIIPKNKAKFDKHKKKALKYINANPVSSDKYRNYGTNTHVNLCNQGGILPVRNFTKGAHGEAHKVSGETIKDRYDTKFSTCKPCSILCGHKGTFDGQERAVPEYETVGLFGPNLEIFDPVKISEWNEICSLAGLDTISAGVTIGWAMEATEKGLIESNLKFGSPEGVSDILKDISERKGLGADLAMGTRALSKKYGGEDFAIQVKGMEVPAYDPRGCFGHALGYATANRGACHLSTAAFSVEVFFKMADPYALRGKASFIKFMENLYAAVNSLHICQLTAFPFQLEPPLIKFTPVPLLNIFVTNFSAIAMRLMDVSLWPEFWSSTTGVKLSMFDFLKVGERVHVLERYMNTREGISKKDDTLPARFLTEGRTCDAKGRTVPLEKMLKRYYQVRGFDQNGIPKDKTLKKFKIEKK
jgi:aldehyde:ferredoxin oxidoreductase